MINKLVLTVFSICLFTFSYAEEVPLAEEKLPSALRIEDYLDPYDEGAFEELEEYYDNLKENSPVCSLTETVLSNEGGGFFFFYSMDEKYKGLRQRCKILVLLLFVSFIWSFADKIFRRRAGSLPGI